MKSIHNAKMRVLKELKQKIEDDYVDKFDLEVFIDDLCAVYALDFDFEEPWEVLLSMKYIDNQLGDKYDHHYDMDYLTAVFSWLCCS